MKMDPLLAKWMEDPEYKKTAQELWKKLDKMSVSDPAAYRDFMSNVGKSAASTTDNSGEAGPSTRPAPLIRKGFTIKCQGTAVNSITLHLINIARTKAIKKPSPKILASSSSIAGDAESVDVIMSERRRSKTASGQPCYVYDAVFHSLVVDKCYDSESFAQQLIQLAIDCVQETFKMTIHKTDVIDHYYQLPYGWDSSGKAVKDGGKTDIQSTDFLEANDDDEDEKKNITSPDKMTPESLLRNLETNGSNNSTTTEATTSMPSVSSLFEYSGLAPAAEVGESSEIPSFQTRSPMIEILTQDGDCPESLTSPSSSSSSPLFVEPEFSFETNKSTHSTVLRISLPLIISASQLDISYSLENGNQVWMLLESPIYKLHVQIPSSSSLSVEQMENSARVQFIKSKSVLKIQF